ncbi:MAG: C40 family peptidase [Austwickia sp.]|nr:C40 family peptidase [Austwickia sp.]MBK8435382.1 C40 family peptidase [Austwickia sp.]MBK9101071.1 C40 family peptidase [Austwickia sp.]
MNRALRAACVRLTAASAAVFGITAALAIGGPAASAAPALPADSAPAVSTRAVGRSAAARSVSAYLAFGGKVLSVAATKRGTPYRYGAAGPNAFDCSGYTSWVYRKLGRKLPRTAHAQYGATRHLSRSQALPGDLVFFGGRYKHHVAIYAGGNRMWHAPSSGRTVTLAPIYSKRVAFGRLG